MAWVDRVPCLIASALAGLASVIAWCTLPTTLQRFSLFVRMDTARALELSPLRLVDYAESRPDPPLLHAFHSRRDVGALYFKIKRAERAAPDPYLWVVDVVRARTVIADLPHLPVGEPDI